MKGVTGTDEFVNIVGLHDSRAANALGAMGFERGDAIAIDMPMNVRAVTAYLAIILAGCVVVAIPDSFVASEIAVRLRISKAKAIFTQVCDLPLSIPCVSREGANSCSTMSNFVTKLGTSTSPLLEF